MGNINTIIRRTSAMVDTSGMYPPPAIQTQSIMAMGGGVYPQGNANDSAQSEDDIFAGRISLGIIAIFVAGAVAFYIWTNEIQGGG